MSTAKRIALGALWVALGTMTASSSEAATRAEVWRRSLGGTQVALVQVSAPPESTQADEVFVRFEPVTGAPNEIRLEQGDTPRVAVWNQQRVVVQLNAKVFILDVASRSLADRVLAVGASVSPDGRYVAFRTAHPFQAPNTSDVYSVYDVSISPAANRAHLNQEENGGWPIYPENNRVTGLQFSSFTGPSVFSKSSFTWLSNSALTFCTVEFAENSETPARFMLVVADLASGISNVAIRSTQVDVTALIDPKKLSPNLRPEVQVFVDAIVPLIVTPGSYTLRLKIPNAGAVAVAREVDVTF